MKDNFTKTKELWLKAMEEKGKQSSRAYKMMKESECMDDLVYVQDIFWMDWLPDRVEE